MATVHEVAARAREEGIEFFLASFVEMTGASKAKLVPADCLEDLAKEGAGFAGFAAGELGWGPYANDHEDANCQFEINWRYSECLTTADRHTFFKYMVRVLAEQAGMMATFMPKPFSYLTGNGAHTHMSLWDAEKDVNLF